MQNKATDESKIKATVNEDIDAIFRGIYTQEFDGSIVETEVGGNISENIIGVAKEIALTIVAGSSDMHGQPPWLPVFEVVHPELRNGTIITE